jgi:membrane-bound serine protease (ClpP class)
MELLRDPNIVYMLLIFGLWMGVSATYLPGTGIKEILAGVALVGAFVGLGSLPTNWWAVFIMVTGVLSFIVMPFLNNRFLTTLAVGGLVLQGIGALLLFSGISVSPLLIGLTLLVSLGYYRFILIPILEDVRKRKAANEDDELIGAVGRVVQSVNPVGTVHVRGEQWTATSDKPLQSGDQVVVLSREGLQLVVESAKPKRSNAVQEEGS